MLNLVSIGVLAPVRMIIVFGLNRKWALTCYKKFNKIVITLIFEAGILTFVSNRNNSVTEL